MICDSCKHFEDCAEYCDHPTTCPCQHRETELIVDSEGNVLVAPKGARKDVR